MAEASRRHCHFARLICWLYFTRISVVNPENLPRQGPVLFVGLHRNGAVDGFVYHSVLPWAVFLISAQLRSNPVGRLFFDGIEVVRAKDEFQGHRRSDNAAALAQCLDHLRAGGGLFVFPEGTSTLGPRHLPFKSGAAQLGLKAIDSNIPLTIVPVGIFYEAPCTFRAEVEVVVGDPVPTRQLDDRSPLARLREMKSRIAEALEALGTNVESAEVQETIQRLAYVSTLGTPRSYWKSLKAIEKAIPAKIQEAWQALTPELERRRLWYHQGVPLLPTGGIWRDALILAIAAPIVLFAVVTNLPPYLAAWWASRKFADDRNVVSLWKVLVGVPVFLVWFPVASLLLLWLGGGWAALGYAALAVLGIKLYGLTKKLVVAVHNGLRYPELRDKLLRFQALVSEAVSK